MMRRNKSILLLACALFAAGCSKTPVTGLNYLEKLHLDSWIEVNYPGVRPTALGTYVLENAPGDGEAVADREKAPYLLVNYVYRNLDGTITATNMEDVKKQLGDFVATDFYGPAVWNRKDAALYVGVEDMLSDMKVGGKKTSVIPGWLFSREEFDSAQDYVDNVSGTNSIYSIEIVDVLKDIVKWETDSIETYLSRNFPSVAPGDSAKFGYYYIQTRRPSDDKKFPDDTTFYINYTGRLLNGQVFDTTIKDTAKFYGIYSASKSYEPVKISYNGEDYTEIKLSDSSVIDGFSFTLFNMKKNEAGTAVFYSPLGYSTSGSGSSIPGYSPLRFDIELVEKD